MSKLTKLQVRALVRKRCRRSPAELSQDRLNYAITNEIRKDMGTWHACIKTGYYVKE